MFSRHRSPPSSPPESGPSALARPRTARLLRAGAGALFVVSTIVWLTLAACYALRPDALAALTLIPSGFWLAPGLLAAIVQKWLGRRRLALLSAGLWLALPLLFFDSPGRFLPFTREEPPQGARRLRIISLNAAGSAKAAEELVARAPDVVLLQESPSEAQLAALCWRLFGGEGDYVRAPDCSILSRGRIDRSAGLSKQPYFTQAVVRLPSGERLQVVSLRLASVPTRLDVWDLDCWRSYTAHRRHQRAQVTALARAVAADGEQLPLIVGGDFNAPAGDPVYDELPEGLVDAFGQSGRGWGCTILNDFPVQRIDQIWCGRGLSPIEARAAVTQHSDHRMVIADVIVR